MGRKKKFFRGFFLFFFVFWGFGCCQAAQMKNENQESHVSHSRPNIVEGDGDDNVKKAKGFDFFGDLVLATERLEEKSFGMPVFLLFGGTGAGKSACINDLCGVPLKGAVIPMQQHGTEKKKARKKYALVINPEFKKNKKPGVHYSVMGEDALRSQTKVPLFFRKDNLVFCDLPGFSDSEGAVRDAFNELLIYQLVQRVRVAGVIFVAEASLFRVEKSKGTEEVFRKFFRRFPHLLQFREKIFLFITKPNPEESIEDFAEAFKSRIQSWRNEISGGAGNANFAEKRDFIPFLQTLLQEEQKGNYTKIFLFNFRDLDLKCDVARARRSMVESLKMGNIPAEDIVIKAHVYETLSNLGLSRQLDIWVETSQVGQCLKRIVHDFDEQLQHRKKESEGIKELLENLQGVLGGVVDKKKKSPTGDRGS